MDEQIEDILSMTTDRADLLARCIVFGVTAPDDGRQMTPDLVLALARSIATHLPAADEGNAYSCHIRAIRWAARPDVMIEAGVLVWTAIQASLAGNSLRDDVVVSEEFRAFEDRARPFLDTV